MRHIISFLWCKLLITFVVVLFPLMANSAFYYRIDPLSKQAMTALTQLKIDEARQILNQARKLYPDNNIPIWLLNYTDFVEIIVTEESAVFVQLEKNRSARLDRLIKGDQQSPYYKYCLADVNIQWALARVKFKEYVTALREVNRCYTLLTELSKEHPDFKPTLIPLGFLHTLIGSVPSKYQWAIKILGFNGDVNGGIAEMKRAMLWTEEGEGQSFYNLQCLFFLSFIYLNADSDKTHAVNFMTEYMQKRQLLADKLEPLQAYALAGIALKTGNNDLAIRMLTHREQGNGRLDVPYLDYMTGLAYLADGNDRAEVFLRSYAHDFKGRNFIKAAWQRLAWFYLLKGEPEKYRQSMSLAGSVGNTDVDADKAAQRDYESGITPNILLLKARLLSDGGYYSRAQKVLDLFFSAQIISSFNKLEGDYRQARIFDEQGFTSEAILAYQKVYDSGSTDPRYYAANSALKLGAIYERLGHIDLAMIWYDRVDRLDFKEYRNSLTQKAHAGYERTKSGKSR